MAEKTAGALGPLGDVEPGDRPGVAAVGQRAVFDVPGLDRLIGALRGHGFRVVGPVARDGAIVLDEVQSVGDLPAGWGDSQENGRYRLRRRGDGALFGQANGPQSWRQFLFPPRQLLWGADRDADGMRILGGEPSSAIPVAFLGVRACDLRALAVQDRVFGEGPHPDAGYVARRQAAFVVALNCTDPGGTCFCVSMGAGPRAEGGFDLAMTEVVEGGHCFVVEAGSRAGAEVLAEVPHRAAAAAEIEAADARVAAAAGRMGKRLPDAQEVPALLRDTLEHPHWAQVAERCLSCANCTMVCPTCFCSSVEDLSDLSGDHAERWRRWDSCFTADHSYLHGGSVRSSTRSRYRQWLTHKFGTWWDQFGTSGCVGCGRCITWCPVGIDVTEEIDALREGT